MSRAKQFPHGGVRRDAYTASLVDRGYIGICKSVRAGADGTMLTRHWVQVTISCPQPALRDWIQDKYSLRPGPGMIGSISGDRWRVSSADACALLESVYQYSVLKTDQIKLISRFQDHVEQTSKETRSVEDLKFREKMRLQLIQLNNGDPDTLVRFRREQTAYENKQQVDECVRACEQQISKPPSPLEQPPRSRRKRVSRTDEAVDSAEPTAAGISAPANHTTEDICDDVTTRDGAAGNRVLGWPLTELEQLDEDQANAHFWDTWHSGESA